MDVSERASSSSPSRKPLFEGSSPDDCKFYGAKLGPANLVEKPFECKYCDKKFARKGQLVIHTRVHKGENPLVCKNCDKKFSTKDNLATHMRTHPGESSFKCTKCDKNFSDESSLAAHMRSHEELPCRHCDEKFDNSYDLANHNISIHMKPFMCNHCGQKFGSQFVLTLHIRAHTGEKPDTYIPTKSKRGRKTRRRLH